MVEDRYPASKKRRRKYQLMTVYFDLSDAERPTGPWYLEDLVCSNWQDRPVGPQAILYAAREVVEEDSGAIFYLAQREGYLYGNHGDPRDRVRVFSSVSKSLGAVLVGLQLPEGCSGEATRRYALYDPPLRLHDLDDSALDQEWDPD